MRTKELLFLALLLTQSFVKVNSNVHFISNQQNQTIWALEEMEILEENFALVLPFKMTVLLTVDLVVVLVVGLFGTFVTIKAVFLSGKPSRPIMAVILVAQTVHLVTYGSTILAFILTITSRRPIAAWFNRTVATVLAMTTFFGFANSCVSSFFLAAFRLLYIKESWLIVGFKHGATVMGACCIVLTLVINTALTWLYFSNAQAVADTVYYDLYHGYGPDFVDIMNKYNQDGADTALVPVKFVMGTILLITMLEGLIYLNFFHIICQSDRNMKNILSLQALQKRKRATAMSFACEMYGFMIELIMILFRLGFAKSESSALYFGIFLKLNEFALKAMVQACQTQDGRNVMLAIFKRFSYYVAKIKTGATKKE